MAVHEDRRGPRSHRDLGGLAAVLPRGAPLVQRLCLRLPCAALHDPATGRVAVYYGCADTVTGLAFGYIPEIIDFTKQNSIL